MATGSAWEVGSHHSRQLPIKRGARSSSIVADRHRGLFHLDRHKMADPNFPRLCFSFFAIMVLFSNCGKTVQQRIRATEGTRNGTILDGLHWHGYTDANNVEPNNGRLGTSLLRRPKGRTLIQRP
jgi:hypothetical protein